MQEFPAALPFCAGLAVIAARLPAKQAQPALSQLEACTEHLDTGGAGELWNHHLTLKQALQERLGKAKAMKSALRKPRGSSAKPARGPKRRCSRPWGVGRHAAGSLVCLPPAVWLCS